MSAQDDIKATEQKIVQTLESLAENSDNPKQAFGIIQTYIEEVQKLNEQRIAHVLETQTDEEEASRAIAEYQKGITQIEKIRASLPDFENASPDLLFDYMEQSMNAMSDMVDKQIDIGKAMDDRDQNDASTNEA